MWKSTNLQTGEVKHGTWDELCDLDKRQWKLSRDTLKSHSETQENLITRVRATTFSFSYGRVITALFPLTSNKQLVSRKEVQCGKESAFYR